MNLSVCMDINTDPYNGDIEFMFYLKNKTKKQTNKERIFSTTTVTTIITIYENNIDQCQVLDVTTVGIVLFDQSTLV